MRCLTSFLQIFFLTAAIFSLTVIDASASGGACEEGELDFDLEGDACPGLSLMQRQAKIVSAQNSKVAHEVTASKDAHAAAPSAAKAAAAAKASTPWHYGALAEAVGPLPLSLLAFQTDLHNVDKSNTKLYTKLGAGGFVFLVVLPLLVIGAMCAYFCLWADGKDDGGSASDAKTQKSSLTGTAGAKGFSGAPVNTQGSLASSSNSLTVSRPLPATPFSPLTPTVRLPVEQQPKMPACLLFPTMAADVRIRNRPFEVYWGSLETPWFQLAVKPGSVDSDRLELSEVHGGEPVLCATVNLNTTDQLSMMDGSTQFLVSNKSLKANTRGLSYRSGKDNVKVRNTVASWGSTVPGVDAGDGWLKVGDWYLPMTVDGHPTIVPTTQAAAADVSQQSGLQILRADGMPFATLRLVTSGDNAVYTVMRNGATVCYLSIGTSSFLMEAKLPNGKRVGAVAKEQAKHPSGEMLLELCVEPQMDPVIMLISCIAVLRQLPAHQEAI